MKLLLLLAWRNVWRNRRRSVITILAVVFAVMLSIAMRGLQLGTYEVNIKTAIELFTGYLQIQYPGYQEKPTLQKSFHYTQEMQEVLNSHSAIRGHAPRVIGNGLVSYRDNSIGTVLIGVVPESESRVSDIMEKLNAGQFFRGDSSMDIVVGYKLLENLEAQLGDEVVVLAQGFDGSLGNMKFRITGTLKSGSSEFDRYTVLMGLSTLQELLSMYGRVNLVAVRLSELDQIPRVAADLRRSLGQQELAVLPWDEVVPDMKQTIELDNVSGLLFLVILVLVVAFGIMNTVMMSVTERFREFGITLSIGMPQRKLVMLVFIETLIIMVVGIGIGNLLGAGINYYIVQHPILIGGEFGELYAEYGFLPRLESTLKWKIFFNNSLWIALITIIASLYPIFKVYRLEPLKGIRYT